MTELTSITIKAPKRPGLSEFEINMLLASRLYDAGKITSGQAEEMTGLSKRAFIGLTQAGVRQAASLSARQS
jgi:hypothetical protein